MLSQRENAIYLRGVAQNLTDRSVYRSRVLTATDVEVNTVVCPSLAKDYK